MACFSSLKFKVGVLQRSEISVVSFISIFIFDGLIIYLFTKYEDKQDSDNNVRAVYNLFLASTYLDHVDRKLSNDIG